MNTNNKKINLHKNQNQMARKYFLTVGALISWFAIIAQFYLLIENRITSIPETTIRFFSYFTILTNILVALYFTTNLLNKNSKIKLFFQKPGILTAIAVYIAIVGLIYQIVLRHLWEPKGFQMIVDELLHTLIPIEFIIYWLLFEDKKILRWRDILYWLIYPLLYIIYILIRGSFSDFYPYPFINVTELGYKKVAINLFGLLLLFSIFSVFFIGIAKLLAKKASR